MAEHLTFTKRDPASKTERYFVQCSCGWVSRSHTDHQSLRAQATAHVNGAEADPKWWAA